MNNTLQSFLLNYLCKKCKKYAIEFYTFPKPLSIICIERKFNKLLFTLHKLFV